MGVSVEENEGGVIFKINGKPAKISKRGTIAVTKPNASVRAYNGVKKPARTHITITRIIVAWKRGYIEANELALFVPNKGIVVMTVANYQKAIKKARDKIVQKIKA